MHDDPTDRFLSVPAWTRSLVTAVLSALVLGACGTPQRGSDPWYPQTPAQDTTAAAAAVTGDATDRPPAPLPQPLDLQQAVAHALARNPDLQVAAARLQQAEAMLALADAAFRPSLQLGVEYLQADAPSTYLFKTIDQRDLPPRIDFNDPGRVENLETGIGLQYNLYNGGRDSLATRQAAVGVDLATVDTAATRNRLIAGVMTAWHQVAAAGDLIATAENSVTTVQAQLAETRAVFEAGGEALKSDVLSLKARLAEAQEEVIRARNARRLAATALLELLGEEADAERALVLGADQPLMIDPDPEALLADALRLRPELRRVRLALERAQLDAEQAAAAWRPRLDVVGRVYWDDEGLDYRSDETNWMAALRMNWVLYDGGARHHRHDAALAGIAELRATDRKLLLSVRSDLQRSRLRLEEAQARLQTAEAGLEAAGESLELVATRYAAGAATVTRYLEAELMHHRARLRRIRAATDLRQSRVDLARASGRFLREDAP